MTGISKTYLPINENHLIYRKLYSLYRLLHDSFGTVKQSGNLFNVMKELLDIRDNVRKDNVC